MTSDRDVRVNGRCVCGAAIRVGYIGADLVQVCSTGEHVTLGRTEPKVYIYVENPGDVIDTKALCWLCGGVDPNDAVKVAREYPGGPVCPVYTVQVHPGCWQDMDL